MPSSESGPRRTRALIVDDSALMRKLLVELLTSTGEIEVVGTARDGLEAITEVARLRPDVVTLDVQMPGPSGIQILPQLLDAHLVPVVMVSALTQEGADVTFEALELGAVDYMPKPERYQLAEMRQSGPQLVAKVLSAAKSRVRRPRAASASPARRTLPSSTGPAVPSKTVLGGPTDTIVVIGISTGGPQTLASLFPQIEPPMPAIVVVQHMPARFTYVLAERLNRSTALHVKEAEHGEPLLPSHVYIAPGGRHLEIAGTPGHARIALGDAPPVSGHRPSVDVLFQSAARVFGKNTVGFIMTGMGRDGVDGCKAILAAGGATYGQDEATSIVYGMNKAAQLEGAVRAQFAAEELPTILRLLSRRAGE